MCFITVLGLFPTHDIIGPSMIQLIKSGLAGSADLEVLANQFRESRVFRLPRLLHSEVLDIVWSRLDQCAWTTHDDGKIAREVVPDGLGPLSVLNFVTNTPEFLDLMRRITGHDAIRLFTGRVYKMEPSGEHFDTWHADVGSRHKDRLVGMSINLSPRTYQGGVFRLRDEASGQILCELPNTGPGDAIFFEISPALKHMVSPLEGSEPKIAYAGWFRSGETDFYSTLRGDSITVSAD